MNLIKLLTTPIGFKTPPIITVEVGDLGLERPDLISEGTIDSLATDSVMILALNHKGGVYCLNLNLNRDYGSRFQLALGKMQYRFNA